MGKKHLSLDPQTIDEDTWYYEDMKGIDIRHDVQIGTKRTGSKIHVSIQIPWAKLRASLKRRDDK